jgi:hypothetical protein
MEGVRSTGGIDKKCIDLPNVIGKPKKKSPLKADFGLQYYRKF